MEKLRRNERIGALMNVLTNRPNHIFTYNYFTDKFNAAKSTISEDIVILKRLVNKLNLGHIETISGAAGGVKFVPQMSQNQIKEFLMETCEYLSSTDRIIPGGFIYMTDILYYPDIVNNIGRIFASYFANKDIDYVVTVETKGIPIALTTANVLNVPLVIVRRNAKVTEGPTVSINYVTGSTKQIHTMSLSRKAIKEGSNVLIIDDFMKAGGTAKGIKDMMKEFNVNVSGIGVFISTEHPNDKLVKDYISLLTLKGVDEEKEKVYIEPSKGING